MQANTAWTRRRLLKVGGLSLGAGVVSRHAAGARGESPGTYPGPRRPASVYMAGFSPSRKEHGVHVLRAHGGRWGSLQFVPSAAPSSLAASADGRTLFVTNGIDSYQNLPAGSVESWNIDAKTGLLTLLSRQALALTAIHPSHAAVSQDGSRLAVSAAEGSLCVLLPIHKGGPLGEPIAVRRELRLVTPASASSTAAAAQLCFAPNGHLVIANFRQRSLSTFLCTADSLQLRERVMLPAACTSVSFVRQASSLELHLQDELYLQDKSRRQLAAFDYAGELLPIPQSASSAPLRTPAWPLWPSFGEARSASLGSASSPHTAVIGTAELDAAELDVAELDVPELEAATPQRSYLLVHHPAEQVGPLLTRALACVDLW